MNGTKRFVTCLGAALALALPVAAPAQQQGPATAADGTVTGPQRHGGPMMRAMAGLDLSADQRARLKQIREQYRQAHPKGSPRDPQAARAMRAQVMNVLTPAQQARFRGNLKAMRQNAQPGPGAGPPDSAASPPP